MTDAIDPAPDAVAPAPSALAIDAVVASKVSFATQQNAVPVLKELRLASLDEKPLHGLRLEIEADPPVFASKVWRFDRLDGGAEVAVRDRDLQLNAAYLQQLSEAVRATLTLRVRADGPDTPVLAERRWPVEVLARNEWGGAGAQPELLAAFVLPNDPAVSRLLKAAAQVLSRAGKRDAIDGYQSGSRERAYELASAVWSAVATLRLTYAEPPASFELQGQKVRSPSAVLEAGLATCLDTALLFAAALEQAGLYPVLVLTKGHAFAGVWLQPQEFATLLVEDAAALRKRLALQELVLFETTLATGTSPAGFGRAVAEGERRVSEAREAEFVMAVDVRRARLQRIRPLALAEGAPPVPPAGDPEAAHATERLEEAPALGGFALTEPEVAPTTPEGRLERWRRQLLDLTTRNRLLNAPPGANALRLLCPDPAHLEDRLAGGASFRLVALPQLEGAAGRDAELHTQRTGEVLDVAYARDALGRGELLSPLPADKLDAQLTDLYRKAKSDLAEGGANTLFLAVGFLSWKKTAADPKSYRAPLILLPVQLERRSVRTGVRLKAHEDEPRFNLTLLQMLRQDFDLDLPELAGPLPTDSSGVDVHRIWNLVRRAVRDAPGFEVTEDVLLGVFSFAKHLMWKDLTDRTEALKRNPVVRHLLETPRERYTCDGEPPRPDQLDSEVAPAELFAPLPADSSQLAAVVGSARGCDFVLDGPPGTGKSQTIANMIAHNLAMGRKVLFVAEKRAALEVVHRRLVQHGLGPFCLELHSNKAVKADVLAQLDSAWSTRESLNEGEWERRAAELKATRDGLNRLVRALHTLHPNGLTLHQAIGRVVRDGADRAVRLSWPDETRHDAAQMDALRQAARQLDVHRIPDMVEAAHVFAWVGRGDWSPRHQTDLLAAAAGLATSAARAASARDRFLERLGAPFAADAHGLSALAALSRALEAAAGLDQGFAFDPDAARTIARTREALASVRSYHDGASGLSAPLNEAAVRAVSVDALARDWAAAKAALWPLSILRRGEVAKRLNPSAKADVEADLPRLRRMQEALAHLDLLASAALAPGWAGLDSDAARLEQTLDAAEALRAALASAADSHEQLTTLRATLRRLCSEDADLIGIDGAVGRAGADWREAYEGFETSRRGFEAVAAPTSPLDAPDLLAECQVMAARLQAHAPRLNAWCAWRRAVVGAADLGLQPLTIAAEAGAEFPGGAADAFELAYARWWAEATAEREPAVRDFNLAAQTDAVTRFRELDARVAELTRLHIRARLAGRVPSKDAKARTPGLQALAHQIAHPKSRKRLRELVVEMGAELTTLTPCLLMSPLSVAQYLPADLALFDLVIFDEASQIAPWDAVGAIARGRQLVVAGDPKQMPPTSFFDRGASAEDDDSDVEADQESILDECLSASLPQRRLTWHYRSRNESLIAFSNHRYYDGDLVTFPAPVVKDTAVRLRQVEGAWARGKTRTNQVEAHAMVSEAVRRLLDPAFVDEAGRRLSLAVITLNSEQQKLVEDLLDRARRADPRLEPFFAEDATEPVVVKNLETVQGDERDLILLGIGYGPETPGAPVMSMNFGPLNRQGGWRRLNVAITRARREMTVFTSFPTGLIDLNRTSASAVRDLRRFLDFAERGPRALGEAVAGSVGGFDSPFEEAVAGALRDRGWKVVPQIGASRFRIDLGVVHPDRPGDYLLGVECDGASYHSAATARDRDKVREAVLKGLGWSLIRVWSVDWWIDPDGALDRLVAALEAELAASRVRGEAKREAGSSPQPLAPDIFSAPEPEVHAEVREDGAEWTGEPGADYRLTTFEDMEGRLDASRFQEAAYAPVLREMVSRVVAQEGPIRDDALVERIARAHGIRRNGRRVRERVLSLARGAAHLEVEPQGGGAFVWPDAGSADSWSRARYPARPQDCRPLEDIALPELAAALRDCGSDDPVAEAARRFGVRRLSPAARDRLTRARQPGGHLTP